MTMDLIDPPKKDITEDEQYAKFVESMAHLCHCNPLWGRPCDGVLAGGLCDNMGNNDCPEDYRDHSEPDGDY